MEAVLCLSHSAPEKKYESETEYQMSGRKKETVRTKVKRVIIEMAIEIIFLFNKATIAPNVKAKQKTAIPKTAREIEHIS